MEPLIFIGLMVALLWLLVIRPQRKRSAQMSALVSGLSVGDEIVTAGGMYGTITRMDQDVLTVEIAPETTVRIARGAVTGVVGPDDAQEVDPEAPIATNDS